MQERLQVGHNGLRKVFVPVLLAHVGDVEQHPAGGLELMGTQGAPLQIEAGGVRELVPKAGGQIPCLLHLSQVIVVFHHLGHHVIVPAEP